MKKKYSRSIIVDKDVPSGTVIEVDASSGPTVMYLPDAREVVEGKEIIVKKVDKSTHKVTVYEIE